MLLFVALLNGASGSLLRSKSGDVVQLVRTSDCRSEGRGFDPRRPRHIKQKILYDLIVIEDFFILPFCISYYVFLPLVDTFWSPNPKAILTSTFERSQFIILVSYDSLVDKKRECYNKCVKESYDSR